MNTRHRLPTCISAASALVLSACGALTWAGEEQAADENPYAPLALESRPLQTRWQTDYAGAVRLGVGYTDDDNYSFGQYNGLSDDGASVIGDLRWQDFSADDHYWQVSLSDMGLDTREGEATWGRHGGLKVTLGLDSQQQVRNDSGATPFRGNYDQSLPGDWVSGLNTSDFANLTGSLRDFDRELDRDKLYLGLQTPLGDAWQLRSNLSYEEKEGHGDTAGGIYINGASADAVLLRAPVDYTTTEFDLGLAYSNGKLHLDGELDYSEFDNDEESLVWQNPYSCIL
mgnify:FL=1